MKLVKLISSLVIIIIFTASCSKGSGEIFAIKETQLIEVDSKEVEERKNIEEYSKLLEANVNEANFIKLIKNNFRLTVLGTVAGSVGATALNMGVKTVLVGTAFTIGQKIGNVFGATIDTLVDNAQGSANDFFSKMMNRAGATDLLHDVGFGSGSPNFDFRRHSNSSSSVFWNSNPYLIKN